MILAYGDFSYDNRYGRTQIILYRNSLSTPDTEDESLSQNDLLPDSSFRIVSRNDEYLWDHIGGGFEVLSACPVGRLLETVYDEVD